MKGGRIGCGPCYSRGKPSPTWKRSNPFHILLFLFYFIYLLLLLRKKIKTYPFHSFSRTPGERNCFEITVAWETFVSLGARNGARLRKIGHKYQVFSILLLFTFFLLSYLFGFRFRTPLPQILRGTSVRVGGKFQAKTTSHWRLLVL